MPTDTNLGLIFLTGITTGGLTCVAVQGGLLASVLTSKEEEAIGKKLLDGEKTMAILSFLIAKVMAYSLLGMALGLLGSLVSLTPQLRGWLQIAIGIYLLGVAGSILDIHPLFRYFVIKPPKSLARLVKKQTGSSNWLAPAFLGALTVFLPCATTQAMEVLAIGTGSVVAGGLIMMAFTLGTAPTFFLVGFLLSKAAASFKVWFDKVAVVLLVILAIFSINGGVAVMGSVYTLQNFIKAATTSAVSNSEIISGTVTDGKQEVIINVAASGYSPNEITIKRGIPTIIKLITSGTAGCARAFTIPSLGIQKILPVSGEETVEFTPTKTGSLVFSCSMGMYTGRFNVI